jgi:hypothetical protein
MPLAGSPSALLHTQCLPLPQNTSLPLTCPPPPTWSFGRRLMYAEVRRHRDDGSLVGHQVAGRLCTSLTWGLETD